MDRRGRKGFVGRVSKEKDALRQAMKLRLREAAGEREGRSAAICREIAQHPAWLTARTVALFDSMLSEPALEMLWPSAGKQFLLPRIEGEKLRLVKIENPGQLGAPAFKGGYREPATGSDFHGEIDLILVPGLAFTRAGARLGRGGGFYDRLLARLPPGTVRLGVCFAFQLVPALPLEPHDERLHGVVTDAGLAA